MSASPDPPRWRRNQIAVVASAFVGFTGFTVVMPFLPLYFRDLGVTNPADVARWSGLSMGVTPLVAALCGPLWGRVADRLGNKILVQRSLLSFAVAMAALAFVTEAWQVFALRAVQGLVAGYGPLTIAMAARSAPRHEMSRAIGAVQTGQRLGPALGPLIGGLLAPLIGLRGAFLAAAAIYIGAFILLTAMYREPPLADAARAVTAPVSFRRVAAIDNLLRLMMVIFGVQLVDRSFGPVLALHLEHLGQSAERVPVLAGVLFSVLALAGAAGNQIAGRLLARFTARRTIAGAAITGAVALVAFSQAAAPWALAATLGIVGVSIGIAATTAFTAAGTVIPEQMHGAGFGFVSSASLAAGAVSPVLSGVAGAVSIEAVFAGGAAVLVAVAVVVRGVINRAAMSS